MTSEPEMFYDEIASDFEAIVKHPEIEAVIELAREEQQRIDAGEVTDIDEIEAIVDSLDSLWGFHHQYGCISGHAKVWQATDEYGSVELRDTYLSDAILQSRGFVVQRKMESEESRPQIYLLFLMSNHVTSDLPLIEVSRDLMCAVSLQNIDLSGFTTEQSMDIATMNTYLPEAAQDLYAAIYDASEQGDGWYSELAPLVVEIPNDNVADGLEAMVAFADRHYNIAQKGLPVVVEISAGAPIMIMDEDNELETMKVVDGGPRYFFPLCLDLRTHCEPNNRGEILVHEDRLSWVVHGTITTHDGNWTQVALPLHSIPAIRELPPLR